MAGDAILVTCFVKVIHAGHDSTSTSLSDCTIVLLSCCDKVKHFLSIAWVAAETFEIIGEAEFQTFLILWSNASVAGATIVAWNAAIHVRVMAASMAGRALQHDGGVFEVL